MHQNVAKRVVFTEKQQLFGGIEGFLGFEGREIKLQMRGKLDFSLDTSPNSPSRIFPEQVSKQSCNNFLMNGSTYYSGRMSETESEIYSHGLIREVMQASRAKSIWHDINRIDQESALYSLPLRQEPYEYQVDSIPSKNQLFLSACSATIKNINEGLAPDRHYPQSARQTHAKRPASAMAKIDTHNKKISVSGLVTYNFNSVLTKKSLGFNQTNHEEKMIKDISTARDRLYCSKERKNRILERSSGPRFRKSQKEQTAIMSKLVTDTDAYLKKVIAQKEENTMIYSQRTKKVNCVKKYMEQEKVDYDMAVHAVTIIDGSHKQEAKATPKPQEKPKDEESQLNRRRTPSQRRPVLIRNFYFIE